MTSIQPSSGTPVGGPANIGGVIYQMLWCLLRLTRYEVRRIDIDETEAISTAVLVLEPRHGGGDAREVRDTTYTVTQLKARSGGTTWSLQEVIKEVLPDLFKAVQLDAPNPVYQFVTDARRGEWEQVERFFHSLRNRAAGEEPSLQLDNSNLLRVGARLCKEPSAGAFWSKGHYTERELFAKIVDELTGRSTGALRTQCERNVWHLLAHFEFSPPLSVADAEKEIDLALSELAERIEDVPDRRRTLLMRLSELARAGNTAIELESFLHNQGLKAIPRSHVPALQARSRAVTLQRVRLCGFDDSQHVQEAFTEGLIAAVQDAQIVGLLGDSGSGKSWHSYALAEALSKRGALVAHVEAASEAKSTLDHAFAVLWNTVKGQDGTLPYDRAARGLPGPPPMRVLIVDRVDDPVVARDLARIGTEDLGIRLVASIGTEASESFIGAGAGRVWAINVPAFSPSELVDYLTARRVLSCESIPSDVRDLLAQPMLARVYCDLAGGTSWIPRSEYQLFNEYWRRRIERNPAGIPTLDLSLLRDLARALLSGAQYPWRAGLVNEKVKQEGSLARLQRTGWFVVHPGGDCSLWHDRLLNWLIADTLVEDLLAGSRSLEDVCGVIASSLDGELKAGGRWMGYVAMDALWLLAERSAPHSTFASVLATLERGKHSYNLYTGLVPTLGDHAVAGLLVRLEQLLSGDPSHRSLEVASCIAQIASPDAVAKARNWLRTDSPQYHTVALHILRRQGDPVSLERLWSLHVQAAGKPGYQVEYERRMDALYAAVRLKPEWLVRKLAVAKSDTLCLYDLVYLLARLPDNGEAWRSLKEHLKAVVPEDKRRCLVRCITVFRDLSEVEFLRGEQNRSVDMVGEAALAALTRLKPELAIQDLARSELRYLEMSRGWHLHRLLAAKPEDTQAAVRSLVAGDTRRLLDMYASAENEIDGDSFDAVLDYLETSLDGALSDNPAAGCDGRIFRTLSFVETVCRRELLDRLRARRGTSLEVKLADYLQSMGPRPDVNARLCDRSALATLELMQSEKLAHIVRAGLDAESWYGAVDAAGHAHKHADEAVRTKLRRLALTRSGDSNQQFVGYVATHAMCFLDDWEGLCAVVMQAGLTVSPYILEQRRDQPVLEGAYVEDVRARVRAGELGPGVLLAAGITRDPSLIAPILQAFTSGKLERDELLAAAIALNVLGAREQSLVAALSSHLGDQQLRERFLGMLLAIETPEALSAVAEELSIRFDANICGCLGRHEGWAARAAALAWQNKDAAERSPSFGLVVPLLGHLHTSENELYLERLAYGLGRSVFGRMLRGQAIEGIAVRHPAKAFRAAEAALRDLMCDERAAMPALLMKLDSERAVSLLLETARTADDEAIELAIADALGTSDLQAQLEAMFASETPNVRRIACVIAGRWPQSELFRQHLRERALDVDERVATASVDALREQMRAQAVHALVQGAIQASSKRERWILMDRAVYHARGSKEARPVSRSVLAALDDRVTPLEAYRVHNSMRKGRDEFDRGLRERAQRKARST